MAFHFEGVNMTIDSVSRRHLVVSEESVWRRR